MLSIKRPTSIVPKASLSLGIFLMALVGSIGVLSIVDPKVNTIVRNTENRSEEQEAKKPAEEPEKSTETEEQKKEDSAPEASAGTTSPQISETYTVTQPQPIASGSQTTQPAAQPAPTTAPTAPAIVPTPLPSQPTPLPIQPTPQPIQPTTTPTEEPKDSGGSILPTLPIVNDILP